MVVRKKILFLNYKTYGHLLDKMFLRNWNRGQLMSGSGRIERGRSKDGQRRRSQAVTPRQKL